MSLDWMCETAGCIPRTLKHSSSRGCSLGEQGWAVALSNPIVGSVPHFLASHWAQSYFGDGAIFPLMISVCTQVLNLCPGAGNTQMTQLIPAPFPSLAWETINNGNNNRQNEWRTTMEVQAK